MTFAISGHCGTNTRRREVPEHWGWFFMSGWGFGFLLEYLLHWIMHRFTLGFHIFHHREFFHESPRTVALHTLDPRLDIKFFLLGLAVISGLTFWFDWCQVLLFWLGSFVHIVLFYELCHALIHHPIMLPRWILKNRLFNWWRGCHLEHHFHAPLKNYSVTLPLLDLLWGSYAPPRSDYPELPHPQLRPRASSGYVLESTS
jgi:hypothetical protein